MLITRQHLQASYSIATRYRLASYQFYCREVSGYSKYRTNEQSRNYSRACADSLQSEFPHGSDTTIVYVMSLGHFQVEVLLQTSNFTENVYLTLKFPWLLSKKEKYQIDRPIIEKVVSQLPLFVVGSDLQIPWSRHYRLPNCQILEEEFEMFVQILRKASSIH